MSMIYVSLMHALNYLFMHDSTSSSCEKKGFGQPIISALFIHNLWSSNIIAYWSIKNIRISEYVTYISRSITITSRIKYLM